MKRSFILNRSRHFKQAFVTMLCALAVSCSRVPIEKGAIAQKKIATKSVTANSSDEYAGWVGFGWLDWNDHNLPLYSMLLPPEFNLDRVECEARKVIKGVLYCAPSDWEVALFAHIDLEGKRMLSIAPSLFRYKEPVKKLSRSILDELQDKWGRSHVKGAKVIQLDGHTVAQVDYEDIRFPKEHMLFLRREISFQFKYEVGSFDFVEAWDNEGQGKSRSIPHDQWKLNGVIEKILKSVKFLVPIQEE